MIVLRDVYVDKKVDLKTENDADLSEFAKIKVVEAVKLIHSMTASELEQIKDDNRATVHKAIYARKMELGIDVTEEE